MDGVFVDVHSHVVPSGDDGAKSLDDGLELCREAARRGTTVLFATPHVWPHMALTREREDAVRAAHATMAAHAAGFGLELALGFELTPDQALLEQDLGRYRLGEYPAVLVELPFSGPLGLAERVAEEIEACGLMPVIAHPERADAVIEDPEVAVAYRERGWLLQVNATSLLGRHGPERERAAWQLVEDGLADFVASDGHRLTRPPFLDEAYEAVQARVGDAADELFTGGRLPARDGVDLAQRR